MSEDTLEKNALRKASTSAANTDVNAGSSSSASSTLDVKEISDKDHSTFMKSMREAQKKQICSMKVSLFISISIAH